MCGSSAGYYAQELRRAGARANIIAVREDALGTRTLPGEALVHLAGADAIISIARWLSPDIVAACPRLTWFQCLISGTEHLDDLLRGRDIILTNGRGIQGTQMSELAILDMLVHMRQVPRMVLSQAAHRWDRVPPRVLRGRTVTILGVGEIAGDLARLCKAFGMATIGVSRTPRDVPGFDEVVARDAMPAAVGRADFVVVLLPLTPENRGAVGREVLAAMKPEAGLINIARGGVVDEDALAEALRARSIAYAGLDVFQTTPLPPESPLWEMDNVFITCHVGGRRDRYDEDALSFVVPNVEAFASGRLDRMINVVTLD